MCGTCFYATHHRGARADLNVSRGVGARPTDRHDERINRHIDSEAGARSLALAVAAAPFRSCIVMFLARAEDGAVMPRVAAIQQRNTSVVCVSVQHHAGHVVLVLVACHVLSHGMINVAPRAASASNTRLSAWGGGARGARGGGGQRKPT